jgi:hypothetical protein
VGKVFISYSHDSPEHSERVLALSNRLREIGVDAELDRYHVRPPQGWPHWCEEQLRLDVSSFVLVVCTPTYRTRVENRVGADEGRGVYWEGAIIYNYLYNAKGNSRFIPVLLDDAPEAAIPLPLDGQTRYRIRAFEFTDPGFDAIYRELTHQHKTPKPVLGPVVKLRAGVAPQAAKALPEKEAVTDFASVTRPLMWLQSLITFSALGFLIGLVTFLVLNVALLGLPAGGLAVATALYYGAIAAEKEARPQAIKDIARILKNTSWSAGEQPNMFVERIFCLTFADKQFSVKCIIRSIISSFVFLICICFVSFAFGGGLIYMLPLYNAQRAGVIAGGINMGKELLIITIIPDYIAIAKARIIIQVINRSHNFLVIAALVCVDVVLSLLLAFMGMFLFDIVNRPYMHLSSSLVMGSIVDAWATFNYLLGLILGNVKGINNKELFIASTILTSIWAVVALMAAICVKTLLLTDYLRRFTNWFFNVDKHPIRAIGIVAGGIVVVASLIVTVLRATL